MLGQRITPLARACPSAGRNKQSSLTVPRRMEREDYWGDTRALASSARTEARVETARLHHTSTPRTPVAHRWCRLGRSHDIVDIFMHFGSAPFIVGAERSFDGHFGTVRVRKTLARQPSYSPLCLAESDCRDPWGSTAQNLQPPAVPPTVTIFRLHPSHSFCDCILIGLDQSRRASFQAPWKNCASGCWGWTNELRSMTGGLSN